MRIAYQGEAGAYSEAAAGKFSPEAALVPCPAFEDVFLAVESGRVTCGVLPIENSIGGTIHRNYDLLVQHELRIVGEVELPVIHSLVAMPGTPIEALTQIYSHPQALAQCDRFLRSLKGVEVVATYDTAGSAKLIRERNLTTTAAIASERAAQVFGLDILKTGIQDYADNVTRFLVVTRAGRRRRGDRPAHGQQDDGGVLAAEYAGLAVQGAERVRPAGNRRHESGIKAHSRPPLGIPLLPGCQRRPAGTPVGARIDAPCGVRTVDEDTRIVPERPEHGPRCGIRHSQQVSTDRRQRDERSG